MNNTGKTSYRLVIISFNVDSFNRACSTALLHNRRVCGWRSTVTTDADGCYISSGTVYHSHEKKSLSNVSGFKGF